MTVGCAEHGPSPVVAGRGAARVGIGPGYGAVVGAWEQGRSTVEYLLSNGRLVLNRRVGGGGDAWDQRECGPVSVLRAGRARRKCSLQRARADGPADDGVAASAAAHDVKFLVGPATVRALLPAFPVSPGMAGHIRFGRRVGDECLCVH